jgi:hypothetical protein
MSLIYFCAVQVRNGLMDCEMHLYCCVLPLVEWKWYYYQRFCTFNTNCGLLPKFRLLLFKYFEWRLYTRLVKYCVASFTSPLPISLPPIISKYRHIRGWHQLALKLQQRKWNSVTNMQFDNLVQYPSTERRGSAACPRFGRSAPL